MQLEYTGYDRNRTGLSPYHCSQCAEGYDKDVPALSILDPDVCRPSSTGKLPFEDELKALLESDFPNTSKMKSKLQKYLQEKNGDFCNGAVSKTVSSAEFLY